MSTTSLNLDIDAGTDYYVNTTYVDYITNLPKPLAGYSAVMELRYTWDDLRVLQTLSTANGRVVLGATSGVITAHFLPADTSPNQQLPYQWDRAVYDLIITDPNGVKTKLLKGFINIIGTVTY